MTANTGSRKRLSSEQRQGEIITAVLELARDFGPEGVTTQAIADRVGVTQGAVFRHFSNKEAIWLAVFAWVRQALSAIINEALSQPGSPVEKLERTFLAHVNFVAHHPGVPRILFHELQNPGDSTLRREVASVVAGYRKRLAELFKQAKDAGQLSADLNETVAPIVFIGAVQGLVIQAALLQNNTAMTNNAPAIFAMLLNGFRGETQ